MGRTTGVASLKLSELMPLVGGRQSSDFRKLQEVAISSVNGDDTNPAPVIVSVPINTFKEWAKNFGNSQALRPLLPQLIDSFNSTTVTMLCINLYIVTKSGFQIPSGQVF